MDADHEIDEPTGLSRRDMLRRGAVVGAAAVWTVPIVQVVSMTAAHADSPSAPPATTPKTPVSVDPSTDTQQVIATSTSKNSSKATTPATPKSSATGSLAFTGTDAPVVGTVAAGAAAVAIGAGLLAASRKRNGEPIVDAPDSDDGPGGSHRA